MRILIKIFLILCATRVLYAHEIPSPPSEKLCTHEDISCRYHAQWTVDEETQKKLQEVFGAQRVHFDEQGHPILYGRLTPGQLKRWKRLYDQCMGDGCLHCLADGGSCENRTCGENNSLCRPHLNYEGQPICGPVCSDYAFSSILTCNDQP